MIRSILMAATVLLTSGYAFAAGRAELTQLPDFKSIETKNFRFISKEECTTSYTQYELTNERLKKTSAKSIPEKSPRFGAGIFKNIPTGQPNWAERPQCRAEILEQSLLRVKSAAKQSDMIDKFFNECNYNLTLHGDTGLVGLAKLGGTQYNVCEQPSMRKWVAKLPNGDIIRGVLALKPGREARPLVIIRCGVLCNSGDTSQRFMLMHLFDESPFNVLAVANITGADFVRDNGYLDVGGFSEGQQTIRLAKMLKEGPMGRMISSMHVIGVSLGGHGSLYSSYMSPYNLVNGRPILQSSMAICPVVDLKGAMNSLFADNIRGKIARWFYNSEVNKVVSDFPILGPLFSFSRQNVPIPEGIIDSAFKHYSKLKKGWAVAPFEDVTINSKDDLWTVNEFAEFAPQPLQIPTLVVAAKDDSIVNTENNAIKLYEAIAANRNDDNFGASLLRKGNHCAFNTAFGWPTASALYRSYILSHSPEMMKRRKVLSARVPTELFHRPVNIAPSAEVSYTTFRYIANQDSIVIGFKIFSVNQCSNNRDGVHESAAYVADASCFRLEERMIPLSSIPGNPSWARIPRSNAQAEAMTRWANVNLKIRNQDKTILKKGGSGDVFFAWFEY